MNIDDLTIGEAKSLASLFAGAAQSVEHGLCLVVADRGHVWVGVVRTDAEWAYVQGARIVRVWGTTRGLNQLAVDGPLPNTKLDAAATIVKVARRAVIALVPCETSKWSA